MSQYQAHVPFRGTLANIGNTPAKAILLCAITTCLGIQAFLVFNQSINWDEFGFLADVHLLARGELESSVQTFHTHFFRWLIVLPGNEINQIIVARWVMLVLEAATGALIYQCARRFAGVEASLIAVLAYLSFSYVMQHGASFRYDPPSIFLLMAATTFLVTSRLGYIATTMIGALVAIAALITIKSVFLVPTFAAIALWRLSASDNARVMLSQLAFGAIAGAIMLVILYLFHQSYIAAASSNTAQQTVSASVTKAIGESHFFPRLGYWLRSLIENPFHWVLIAIGIGSAGWQIRTSTGTRRWRAVAMLSFALPALTLLFYRNAFPYYYVFFLAPVSVLIAVAVEPLIRNTTAIVGFGAILTVLALSHALPPATSTLAAQRATVQAVHDIFPEPVAYIDRSSMIGSSPKHGFFMSTWGTESYRETGQPIMRNILLEERPAYVLINSSILEWSLMRQGADRRMLEADTETLRNNFIPHWGPIWVAGKSVDIASEPVTTEILIAGRYTIESASPVEIDGVFFAPERVIYLSQGNHLLRSPTPQRLTLRIGQNLHVPEFEPPTGPLFESF